MKKDRKNKSRMLTPKEVEILNTPLKDKKLQELFARVDRWIAESFHSNIVF